MIIIIIIRVINSYRRGYLKIRSIESSKILCLYFNKCYKYYSLTV